QFPISRLAQSGAANGLASTARNIDRRERTQNPRRRTGLARNRFHEGDEAPATAKSPRATREKWSNEPNPRFSLFAQNLKEKDFAPMNRHARQRERTQNPAGLD